MSNLPIHAVLPELLRSLSERASAVLVAPPGAGKTTGVPPALLDAPWLEGRKIILLSPRRLAARAAAHRIAALLGEKVGETCGYRVRLETRVSARTRIEVVTEGVLARLLLDAPDLPDIGAILFDEIHERSLDADLALAMALDVQGALRPDLRLLAMSATLDGARVSALLDDAPVIESQGRMYPVETRYLGRTTGGRIEDDVAAAVRQALREESGSVLVFLPGQAEILRTAERLDGVRADVLPLYGALDLAAQQRAIAPARDGERKIVLATSIAETSLTIEGVRVVIDSGLSRRPRFHPGSGMTRLVTERVSQASAEQRRGRAGRLESGVCYRLWDEPEMRGLIPFDPPEMLDADLTGLALDLAAWGTRDPDTLRWLDPPPAAAWNEAQRALHDLGALDTSGALSEHGKALSRLPLHPRLAHSILIATQLGFGATAALLAALLGETGIGGRDADLTLRLERLQRDSSDRAKALKAQARSWAKLAGTKEDSIDLLSVGKALALAWPDRIAKARSNSFLMVNGSAASLDTTDVLSREPWLAIGEISGSAGRARILSAAAISESDVRDLFADRISSSEALRIEGDAGTVRGKRIEKLGAIQLSEAPLPAPSVEAVAKLLSHHIATHGFGGTGWSESHAHWQARVQFLHSLEPDAWPDVRAEILRADLDWLAPYLAGISRLADIDAALLHHALDAILGARARDLARLAPSRLETPAGTSHAIDYAAPGGPAVELRVQEVFGLNQHPTINNGSVPLTLVLLSPAHRPVQTTRDLPGFWRSSWPEVKTEMKGRYPRHVWPDDPTSASATTRAKPRGT